MKKILATLTLAALTATAANAQAVLGYSVSETQGTYTPLTDPTVIFDGANTTVTANNFVKNVITPDGIKDSAGSAQGFSLGFELEMAGEKYTDFLVSPAGYIYLGNGEIDYNPMMQANFMSWGDGFNTAGFAVNFGVDFTEATKIAYQVLGSGDDARLVLQFTDYGVHTTMWDAGTPVDIQVIYYKNGDVSYVFNDFAAIPEGKDLKFWLCVRQGANYICGMGNSGALGVKRNSRENSVFGPATPDGTTVTLKAPSPCVTPAAQPTDLKLERTSNQVEGSFTPCEGADTYLVVYTSGEKTAGTPADGVTYAEGETLGEATVAYFGPETEFDVRNLPGGTDYSFTVFATSAYGADGPKYNTVSPLTGSVSTLPAPVTEIVFSGATLDSFDFKVTPNEADDEIVVLYNSYCQRDSYGDHGLFGEIPADVKEGDVIPAPEDFTPYWNYEGAPMPANAGTVAYIGKAGSAVTISGLEASTGYYLAVYTRNAKGEYTSEPLYTGWSTNIDNPYDGNSYNFQRYTLPFAWSGSTGEDNTVLVRNEEFWDRANLKPRQGTQVMQQRANMSRGDAANGKEAWLTPAPVYVNDRHLMAKFDYCITVASSRFQTDAYNDWAEGDLLQIRVSEDNGETWKAIATYNDAEHPAQAETLSYVNIAADLNDYRGKTVLVQLYWKTFAAPAFGANMYIDRFSISQADFPAVPEVSVAKVTDNSAVVSWISKQTDYELVYNKKGGDITYTVQVKGATSYTLEGLEANTEYEVKVRGILVDEESGEQTGYSEWSDLVTFTTADYPEVDAPVNLKSDVETLATLGYVILSWDKVAEANEYEVAYRLSSSTEWVYLNTTETSMMLTDLESGENYVWKVRAFCTHDRETAYSAQARFTAPEVVGIEGVDAEGVSVGAGAGFISVAGAEGLNATVYNVNGALVADGVARDRYEVVPGLYVVAVAGKTYKVMVK